MGYESEAADNGDEQGVNEAGDSGTAEIADVLVEEGWKCDAQDVHQEWRGHCESQLDEF
jgi:hypothetical protein